jgi:hypothetical protein
MSVRLFQFSEIASTSSELKLVRQLGWPADTCARAGLLGGVVRRHNGPSPRQSNSVK